MSLIAEHDFEGEYGSGRWLFTSTETGERKILEGKRASLLSLLLADAGYELRPDFHPADAFTGDSLERGQPLTLEL